MKNKILEKNNITGREILQKKIIDMPEKPGVYRMIGIKKNVLYVGKAKNLKKRLLSYTRPNGNNNRITKMISLIKDVEITITETEMDALLLELVGKGTPGRRVRHGRAVFLGLVAHFEAEASTKLGIIGEADIKVRELGTADAHHVRHMRIIIPIHYACGVGDAGVAVGDSGPVAVDAHGHALRFRIGTGIHPRR